MVITQTTGSLVDCTRRRVGNELAVTHSGDDSEKLTATICGGHCEALAPLYRYTW